jgi:hypothetical protein
LLATVVLVDNAFWPAAAGMPPTIVSSNNAKTVSRFIDIIYILLVTRNTMGNINSYEGYL